MENYRVLDNFLPAPAGAPYLAVVEAVRQDALLKGFGTWAPSCDSVLQVNSFKGVGYMGDHGTMLRALAAALGGVQVYPHEMKFRITGADADASYIHSDRGSGHLTCVAYLSHEPDPESGTAFFRYRPNEFFPNGLDRMPCYRTMVGQPWGDRLKAEMLESKEERWEPTGFVRAIVNTAVVFRADLFHQRLPILCTGDTPDKARMVWVCHFTTPHSSF